MKKILFLLISILILLSSCKKNESTAVSDNSGREKGIYPDIILENAEYHIGEDGSDPIYLKAGKITFYSADAYALTESMDFVSKDENGNITISGSAGKGWIDTEGSSMNLSEGVVFKDEERNMKINADNLVFDREEDTIVADGRVVVESEEGSFIGRDFKGDLRTGVYIFSEIEEGELNFE